MISGYLPLYYQNWRKPLHCAAEFGSEDIANLLIENSADTDPEDYVLHIFYLSELPQLHFVNSRSCIYR